MELSLPSSDWSPPPLTGPLSSSSLSPTGPRISSPETISSGGGLCVLNGSNVRLRGRRVSSVQHSRDNRCRVMVSINRWIKDGVAMDLFTLTFSPFLASS